MIDRTLYKLTPEEVLSEILSLRMDIAVLETRINNFNIKQEDKHLFLQYINTNSLLNQKKERLYFSLNYLEMLQNIISNNELTQHGPQVS